MAKTTRFDNKIQNDSMAVLTRVIDKCTTIENVVIENRKDIEVVTPKEKNLKPEKETKNRKREIKSYHGKKRVTWVGTSLSNVLDKKKFENDCDVNLTLAKAYCVDEEEKAVYKDANFKAVVPKIVDEKETDILVLQTGSIEITDLNIKGALEDTAKGIEKYKEEWFKKIENASATLFDVAQSAIGQDDTIEKVVIVKRLPRFDDTSKEIRKIRSDLSEYGNSVYDQIWLKRGRPNKIQIVELDIKCSQSGYRRSIIFGNQGEQ